MLKWNGKYVDTDNAYGAQCMDLMHQYIIEVLGLSDQSILAAACAKDVYINFPIVKGHEYFVQIGNTPTGIPDNGDLVFWGNSTYGHVAIFISGDTNNFTSFDQNYPTGSFCLAQGHTYANVLGWLRYKGAISQNNDQQLIDQLRADRDKNWQLYQQQLAHSIDQESTIAAKQKTIDTITAENLNLKEQYQQAINQHSADLGVIQGLEKDKESYTTEILQQQSEIAKLTLNLETCQTSTSNLSYATNKQLLSELLRRLTGRK
jgi:hypothetical protein